MKLIQIKAVIIRNYFLKGAEFRETCIKVMEILHSMTSTVLAHGRQYMRRYFVFLDRKMILA